MKSNACDQDLARKALSEHMERYKTRPKLEISAQQHTSTVIRVINKMIGKDKDLPQFRPVYDKNIILNSINKRSSAGFPYFKKKGDLLDLVPDVVDAIKREEFDMTFFSRPSVIHRVLQPGDGEVKNR
jgi:transposase